MAALEPYPEVQPKILLLPIPPTEDVPQTKYGDTNSTEELEALGNITETFNLGLYNGSRTSGNTSSEFLYWAADNWWKDISGLQWQARGPYNGSDLQLSVTDAACLVLKSGKQCAPCRDQDETNVCENPDAHLYWFVSTFCSLQRLSYNVRFWVYIGTRYTRLLLFKKICPCSCSNSSTLPTPRPQSPALSTLKSPPIRMIAMMATPRPPSPCIYRR